MRFLHLLEPEETVGSLWHRLVSTHGSAAHFPHATVTFAEVENSLRLFFHGLGGEQGVTIKAACPDISHHRLDLRHRLGLKAERVPLARYDGESLLLPDKLDLLPQAVLNQQLYYWLAAWSAVASCEPLADLPADAFLADIVRLDHSVRLSVAVIKQFPGLERTYRSLAAAFVNVRPVRRLPPAEAELESLIVEHLQLAAAGTIKANLCQHAYAGTSAPRGYKPFLPVPLWGEITPSAVVKASMRREEEAGASNGNGDDAARKAKRRPSDQIDRKGGLIVHRFEKILTWTEFMNLHRDVEDDEEGSARKAADDHDEIGVTDIKRKAATRLKLDLDLSPTDADAERISDKHVYPEWDCRRQILVPGHARVLQRIAEELPLGAAASLGPDAERRIRAVRRQFEALRPRREIARGQLDGHEIDTDAVIRARADLLACGESSDRIWKQSRANARDLSIAVLVDVSRSTEAFVGRQAVIDVEKEALVALVEGLAACGDACAAYAFSSLRRDRVFVPQLKTFDEPAGARVRSRIFALQPGFYTRLGAAVRHVSAALAQRPTHKRLLLVITDGKPNDLDHYDGRYGIEDSRRAVMEARRQGQSVYGITVDAKARDYFPRIFGAGAFAILSRPERLTSALPGIYRHLLG